MYFLYRAKMDVKEWAIGPKAIAHATHTWVCLAVL